jgi:hypothetical protein
VPGGGDALLVYQVPPERCGDICNGHPLGYVALALETSSLSLHLMPVSGDGTAAGRLAKRFRAAGKKLDMVKPYIRFRTADDLALDVIGEIVARLPPDHWLLIAQAARRR